MKSTIDLLLILIIISSSTCMLLSIVTGFAHPQYIPEIEDIIQTLGIESVVLSVIALAVLFRETYVSIWGNREGTP